MIEFEDFNPDYDEEYDVDVDTCEVCGRIIDDPMEPHYCPWDMDEVVDYGDDDEQEDGWAEEVSEEDDDELPF
jgi:hypothetical protein